MLLYFSQFFIFLKILVFEMQYNYNFDMVFLRYLILIHMEGWNKFLRKTYVSDNETGYNLLVILKDT